MCKNSLGNNWESGREGTMGRDNKLIAMLRQIGRSRRVSGTRRLAAIDQLAEMDNIYHLRPDAPFGQTPVHALQIVKRLLNRLVRDPKVPDRAKAKGVDRIAFIRGWSVTGSGLYRVPKTEAIKVPSKRSAVESLRAEVDELLKGKS
jgi:hypothetical protein